jgi:hypothetical protein
LGWLLKKNAGNSGGTFVMNPSKKTIQLGCVLLLIEGVYMAASRWAFWSMGYGIQSELWRTGIRSAAALCR